MKGHVEVQGDGVDRRVDLAGGQQRRQAGGKPQPLGALAVIERLDPKPIASQHHPPGVTLMNGKGEHAVEPLDTVRPPGVIGLENHLGVAGAEELIALSFQLGPQLGIVVDRAVVGN